MPCALRWHTTLDMYLKRMYFDKALKILSSVSIISFLARKYLIFGTQIQVKNKHFAEYKCEDDHHSIQQILDWLILPNYTRLMNFGDLQKFTNFQTNLTIHQWKHISNSSKSSKNPSRSIISFLRNQYASAGYLDKMKQFVNPINAQKFNGVIFCKSFRVKVLSHSVSRDDNKYFILISLMNDIIQNKCHPFAFVSSQIFSKTTSSRCFINRTSLYYYNVHCRIVDIHFSVTFDVKIISEQKKIWSKRFTLVNYNKKMSIGSMTHAKCFCKVTSSLHACGYWVLKNETWFWDYGCKVPVPFAHKKDIYMCLQKKKVLLIGDSHMRNRAISISRIKEVPFIFSTIPQHLYSILLMKTNFFKRGEEGFLILNTGQWGLHDQFLSVPLYISDMEAVLKVVQEHFKEITVIWVESTPVSGRGRSKFRAQINVIIPAFNAWVNLKISALNWTIIHAYNIAKPMQEQTVDTSHYLDEQNITKYPKTNVGGVITSIILQTICSNEKQAFT